MLRQLSVPLSESDFSAAALVLTELVTNAIRHGSSGEDDVMVVEVFRSPGTLRLHVCQSGALYLPDEVRMRKPGETRGWGLLLLDRLCSSWGVDAGAGAVWAEMAVDS